MNSSAIEEANKEITLTAVLCDPGKRHPYLKILPEQKAIIASYAANNGIVKAVRQFSKDFPENSLKESMIRGLKKTYLKELFSSRKKAGKDNYDDRIAEARAELKSANRESFPYIMHIVDEPRKFSPSNVLTYTVYTCTYRKTNTV